MTNPTLPAAAARLTEATSVAMAEAIQTTAIQTSLAENPIPTAYALAGSGEDPILLIHGFDSSQLEFRRLWPRLAQRHQTWAVDLLGFGFSDRTHCPQLSPGAIKQHLYAFWQQMIRRPMVLVGASMGGAAAIDFALTYPEAVASLVLIDSAGFAAGPAMGNLMVPPLDSLATGFLRNAWVRRSISKSAYFDQALVTPDAELCAALHLDCPRWKEALIAFTKSGGYNFLNDKIASLTQPTLVVWGKQDRILGLRDADRFQQAIPHSHLVWIDACGHVPHLEKPQDTAEAIQTFLARLCPTRVSGNHGLLSSVDPLQSF
ncbi:MAG: alpha/beta hydrolase [Leptolyngbya sp.]|nr:alpha/beta hydrolase [Leptolyngbya sp.]